MVHIYTSSKAGMCNSEATRCPYAYISRFEIMKRHAVWSNLKILLYNGSDLKPPKTVQCECLFIHIN